MASFATTMQERGATKMFFDRAIGEKFRITPSGCVYEKCSSAEGRRWWMEGEAPIPISGGTWTWEEPTEEEYEERRQGVVNR